MSNILIIKHGSLGDIAQISGILRDIRENNYGEKIFILTGNGDVVEPEDSQIASIGSGGNFAISAARALKKHLPDMDEEKLVKESLEVAADLCIYTNHNIKTLILEGK